MDLVDEKEPTSVKLKLEGNPSTLNILKIKQPDNTKRNTLVIIFSFIKITPF
jgi:hypothetical protein